MKIQCALFIFLLALTFGVVFDVATASANSTTESSNTTESANATTAAPVVTTMSNDTSNSTEAATTSSAVTSNVTAAANSETTTAGVQANATNSSTTASADTTTSLSATSGNSTTTVAATTGTTAAAAGSTASTAASTAATTASTAAAAATSTAAAAASTAAASTAAAAADTTTTSTTTTTTTTQAPTKAPETVTEVKASVKLQATYSAELADTTSEKFKNESAKIGNELTEIYKNMSGFKKVEVTGFKNGSIIVEFKITVDTPTSGTVNTTAIAETVTSTLKTAVNSGTTLGGSTVDVSSISATATVVKLPRVCSSCTATGSDTCSLTDKTCSSADSECWAVYERETKKMTVGCSEDMTSLIAGQTCASATGKLCHFVGTDSKKCFVQSCCTSNQCSHPLSTMKDVAASASRVTSFITTVALVLVIALM